MQQCYSPYQTSVTAMFLITPFGSAMPTRAWTDESRGYRYGFNGMEKDDEVKGEGNHYTTEFRQYDPRVGRWFSLDPMKDDLLEFSAYHHVFNSPIVYKDAEGDIGVVGAFFGAAFELTGQVIANSLTGKKLSEIDWGDVVIAGACGFVGIPPVARLAKHGKVVHKVTKTVMNNWGDVSQSLINFKKDENGKYGFSVNSLDEAVFSFMTSKIAGTVLNKSTKRVVKSIQVNKTITQTSVNNSKKVLNNAEKSLENTNGKKYYKGKQDEISRKQQNRDIAQEQHTLNKIANNVAKVEEHVVNGVNQSTGTSITTGSNSAYVDNKQNNTSSNGITRGTIYTPQAIGNTGYYYMNQDNTRVYDRNTGMHYNFLNGKLDPIKNMRIDVSKPVITKIN